MTWRDAERTHALRAHAEAVAEHAAAVESMGAGSVSAAELTSARAAVLRELVACDCLGFDTAAEALASIRAYPDWLERWDCAGEVSLRAAVERYLALRLAARLAGVRP